MDKDNEYLTSETFSAPKDAGEPYPFKGKWKWVIEYIRWNDGSVENFADLDEFSRPPRTFTSEEQAIRGMKHRIHRVYGDPYLQEPGEDPNREVTITYTIAHLDGAGRSEHVYVTTPAKCTSLLPVDEWESPFGID